LEYINREIENQFENKVLPGKVLVLLGARRVGKSVLINRYLDKQKPGTYLKLNGEDQNDLALLQERTVSNYRKLLVGIDILAIDEAQKIPDIGLKLKLIVDNINNVRVIATGSSMFDLTNTLGEPLVGRKNTLFLYPFSQSEFSNYENIKETKDKLTQRLIYGSYPELEHQPSNEDKEDYLYQIVNDYLLKDILEFEGIRHTQKIYDLLRLIAFQVGNEVSVQELGQQLGIAKGTVDKYLDLLTKVFVLYRLSGFSRNLRKEITKSHKWYFIDNGIRNALIRNFNPVNFRNDIGSLWENYLVYERLKHQNYSRIKSQNYFWRTYDQQEIDWIEERQGAIHAYEIKWTVIKRHKIPVAWSKAYPEASFSVIQPNNYLEWISDR
jgi:hypothetical protein